MKEVFIEITVPGLEETFRITKPPIMELINKSLANSGFVSQTGIPIDETGLTFEGISTLYINLSNYYLHSLAENLKSAPFGYVVEVLQTADSLIRNLGEPLSTKDNRFVVIEFQEKLSFIKRVISSLDGKIHLGLPGVTLVEFNPLIPLYVLPMKSSPMSSPYALA